MNAYRRYLYRSAGTALVVLLVVGLLNLFVDPFNRFGLNRLGLYMSAEREYKNTVFPRYGADAVLLGNSRAAMIDVDGVQGYRFYNAGFAAAKIEEVYFFVEHHVKTQKLAVLSLDAGAFQHLTEPIEDPFQPLTLTSGLKYAFTLQNVEYSIRTVGDHLRGKPSAVAANGTFREERWATTVDADNDQMARKRMQELLRIMEGYHFDPARLQVLRNIRDVLAQRNIRLIVYFAPINARVWQNLEGTSSRAEMNRTREAVKAIFPQMVDLTVSEYSDDENFFRSDPAHFRSAVGQRFLNERVLKVEPPVVGR